MAQAIHIIIVKVNCLRVMQAKKAWMKREP